MLSTQNEAATARTAYHREYWRAHRAGRIARTLKIELSAEEEAFLQRCIEQQRRPVEGAAKRLLMLGAKFAANAGTPRGKKLKTQKP